MNLSFFRKNLIFRRKMIIQTYFILFILLNIFDFFNYLSSDIDFFKKLLSWTIIGYIFYRLSPSKIFIGKKIKFYDIFYIIGFSLMSIVKSFSLYLQSLFDFNNSYIFIYLLEPISKLNLQNLVNNSFIIGLLLIIILSIFLIKNNKINKNSFLGSFNFSNYLIFMKINYLVLILFSIFFGLIIFNLFMEWFALAIDSVILVLGLIFYLFKYFHNHSKNKYSNYLRIISNTGNNFYNKIILMFSNKKTLFIGISFLLTLHLIVDVGVYMVPYSIGTQNSLYFSSLDINGNLHEPLFSLTNLKESLIYKDLNFFKNDFLFQAIIILIYLVSWFSIISIMILPFFTFYKNISKKKIKFKKIFAITFLISIFFFLIISSNLLPNISSPISISMSNSNSIKGVDIQTNQIQNNLKNINLALNEILVSSILFLTILIFLLFRYEKYKFFFDKLILIIALLFFIYYILIFFNSTINSEYNNLYPKSNPNFDKKLNIYLDKNNYKESPILLKSGKNTYQIFPFSDLNLKNISINSTHNDYLYFKIKNTENDKFYFNDLSKIYISKNIDYSNNKFSSEKIEFISYLGENYFTVKKINKRVIKINNNLNLSKNLNNKIYFLNEIYNEKENSQIKDFFINFLQYLRLIFISIFYIFGLLTFIYYYIKNNFEKISF